MVVESTLPAMIAVLEERGWTVRRYKHGSHRISTWANLSKNKYPNRILFVCTKEHAMVVENGRVYDSWTPHGELGEKHPFKNDISVCCYLVSKD
jgi:hypothetical protein